MRVVRSYLAATAVWCVGRVTVTSSPFLSFGEARVAQSQFRVSDGNSLCWCQMATACAGVRW